VKRRLGRKWSGWSLKANQKLFWKANGKPRLIHDLRELNKVLTPKNCFFPKVSTIKEIAGNYNWFCKLDLSNGYLHIPIRDKSRPLLAFKFKEKTYQFTRLPFGLSQAPWLFQSITSLIAKHVGNVIVYLDDFLVFGKTYDECLATTQRLLSFLKDHLWTVNIKSMSLFSQNLYMMTRWERDIKFWNRVLQIW